MIVLVSARIGCLGISAIVALGVAVLVGVARRDAFREPSPLRAIDAATGQATHDAALARAQASGLRPDSSGSAPVTPLNALWTSFSKRLEVGANECVALIVTTSEGYAAPKHAALFDAASAGGADFERSVTAEGVSGARYRPDCFQFESRDALSTTVGWCARRATSLDARVLLSTIDGFRPARRADATVRWQTLRAPWSVVGGPARMPAQGYTTHALTALAATFEEPLAAATREPPEAGLVPVEPSRDVPMGAAALIPVMRPTVALLWDMSARNSGAVGSGISVHPRIAGPLSTEEQRVINATFTELAVGRAIPAEHDPVVDLGRNDFYRVLAVLDTGSIRRECQLVTLTRDEGLFPPRIVRYGRSSGLRTTIARTRDNVAIDRVCPGEVLTYLTGDTDQKTYRITIWQPADAARPAPVGRAPRRTR